MSQKETIQKSFYILASIIAFSIYASVLFREDDSSKLLDDALEITSMERIYNREKPDTTNYNRSLTTEEAKLVDVMSDFLAESVNKAFPHYLRGQSYQEFDNEVSAILQAEIDLFKEKSEDNKKFKKQKTRYQIWGIIIISGLIGLGKLLSDLIKEPVDAKEEVVQ